MCQMCDVKKTEVKCCAHIASYALFTFSSRVIVKTFEELWMKRGTHEVRTDVDIHTLVQELWDRYNSWKSRYSRELAQFPSSTFFTELQTTIYIQELNENIITLLLITSWDNRDILLPFDWGLIYWHVFESFEMKQEQGENVTDKINVPFSSRVVLTRM